MNYITNFNNVKNWVIKNNCNALFSKLNNENDFYLNTFETLDEFIIEIEKRNDIFVFVWHTQDLEYENWRGKGYILTLNDLNNLNILNNNKWTEENNVISGIRLNFSNNNINIKDLLFNNRVCKKITIKNTLNVIHFISKGLFTPLIFLTSYTTISNEISKYNITRIE